MRYNFAKPGQQVLADKYENPSAEGNHKVYGEVIDKDDTIRSVFIEWDDLDEPCWHNEDTLHKIKIVCAHPESSLEFDPIEGVTVCQECGDKLF